MKSFLHKLGEFNVKKPTSSFPPDIFERRRRKEVSSAVSLQGYF